jgi:hypothetical protein
VADSTLLAPARCEPVKTWSASRRTRHDDVDAIASSRGRQKASPRRVDPGRGGDDSHVSDTEADDDMEEDPWGLGLPD